MNMMKMMKQAADMQKRMAALQEDLASRTVEFSSGGGMVTAVARGDLSVEGVTIRPEVVDPEDVDMLQDLVTAAVRGAQEAARKMASEEMGRMASGMGLPPGMNLPF